MQPPLLSLEVLVQLAGPVPDDPDVEAHDVALLGGRADGERMPLERRNPRDVDEDVVAGLEGEVRRPLDHQRHHSARQHHARRHPRLALLAQGVPDAINLTCKVFFSQEQQTVAV